MIKCEIVSNFVAFLENLNFTYLRQISLSLYLRTVELGISYYVNF